MKWSQFWGFYMGKVYSWLEQSWIDPGEFKSPAIGHWGHHLGSLEKHGPLLSKELITSCVVGTKQVAVGDKRTDHGQSHFLIKIWWKLESETFVILEPVRGQNPPCKTSTESLYTRVSSEVPYQRNSLGPQRNKALNIVTAIRLMQLSPAPPRKRYSRKSPYVSGMECVGES